MKLLRACLATGLLLGATTGQAAVSEAEFAALRVQMQALVERVAELEKSNRQLRTAAGQAPAARPDAVTARQHSDGHWVDRLRLHGDLRYRYEDIKLEGEDSHTRHRLRARAALSARINPDLEVVLGVASGGSSPVSADQTLGEAGSSKDLRLDLAYMAWSPAANTQLAAGKVRNTFYRPQGSGLLWSSEYNPEGISLRWENDHLFANAASLWLESDSSSGNRTSYWGLQGGVKLALAGASLTTGASYFELPTAGKTAFFGAADEFYGNSFNCSGSGNGATACVYTEDYEELELFANLELNAAGLPVNIYLDYVRNLAAERFDTGWLAGLQVSNIAGGRWKLGYEYQDLAADGAFALISDSNLGGGGSDVKGHKLSAAFSASDNVLLSLSWYLNNTVGEDGPQPARDYDRITFDTVLSY